ncbi:hypothetical protein RYX36_016241 [Vicia faba]
MPDCAEVTIDSSGEFIKVTSSKACFDQIGGNIKFKSRSGGYQNINLAFIGVIKPIWIRTSVSPIYVQWRIGRGLQSGLCLESKSDEAISISASIDYVRQKIQMQEATY